MSVIDWADATVGRASASVAAAIAIRFFMVNTPFFEGRTAG